MSVLAEVMGLERNLRRGSSVRVRFCGFDDIEYGLVRYHFEAVGLKAVHAFTWYVERKSLYLPSAEFHVCKWWKIGQWSWAPGIPGPARFDNALPSRAAYMAANFEDIRERWEQDLHALDALERKERFAKKALDDAAEEYAKRKAAADAGRKKLE